MVFILISIMFIITKNNHTLLKKVFKWWISWIEFFGPGNLAILNLKRCVPFPSVAPFDRFVLCALNHADCKELCKTGCHFNFLKGIFVYLLYNYAYAYVC